MAYRFNSGRGGVTCDICNLLFDADLSYKEYEETYGQRDDGDICWKCREKGSVKAKECPCCGSMEFNAEGNCVYCKHHMDKKHI